MIDFDNIKNNIRQGRQPLDLTVFNFDEHLRIKGRKEHARLVEFIGLCYGVKGVTYPLSHIYMSDKHLVLNGFTFCGLPARNHAEFVEFDQFNICRSCYYTVKHSYFFDGGEISESYKKKIKKIAIYGGILGELVIRAFDFSCPIAFDGDNEEFLRFCVEASIRVSFWRGFEAMRYSEAQTFLRSFPEALKDIRRKVGRQKRQEIAYSKKQCEFSF